MVGCAADRAAATRVRPLSTRETRNSAITEILNRSQGRTNSGNKETVRLQVQHITANPKDSVESDIHQCAAVEPMTGQRSFGFALRAMIRTVAIGMGDLL